MNKKTKLLLLASLGVVAFIMGYGVVAKAWPYPYHYGYFYNQLDSNGSEVLPVAWSASPPSCPGSGGLALPTWVDTADEFINFITCKLSASTNNRVGAAFIISTLTGMKNDYPGPTEINEFAARVRYAESRGWIDWNSDLPNCPLPNTFYQDDRADVGTYGRCGSGGKKVLFKDASGATVYILKRSCANPAGTFNPIPDDLNFNMSGSSGVDDNTVLPGQDITFTHTLTNGGPTATDPISINWTTQSGPSPGGPWSNVGSGNAGTFGGGQSKPNIGNEGVRVPANAVPNSQICRRIVWSPDTQGGGSEGSAPACATVQYDFSLTPSINVAITGSQGPVTGNIAEPGDTITFNYAVNNSGLTVSQPATCTYRQATYPGYNQAAPATAFTPAGANCAPARTFPGNNTNTPIATEVVPAATVNTSICRSLVVDPATFGGGPSAPAQVCVFVASKPYARAYGGDIAAGGGVATSLSTPNTCGRNIRSAVIGWNKRGGAAAYAGAGAQFAQYAMSTIFDSASGLGASSGPPNSLSFRSNNAVVASGNFGGAFLSAPCIPDHYATRPSVPNPLPASLSTLAPGTYKFTATGNAINLPTGTVNPGVRVSIYVTGNSLINGNITFGGSGTWNAGNIPMLRIVTSGNMFIDNDVTQLDGLYVAQQSTSSTDDGIIFTCTSSPVGGPYVQPTLGVGGTFASTCDTKLTVNGSFVARQVRLLRTIGTLRQSNAADNAGVPFVAEVFNYNPALWITQPSDDAGGADYDAINSLPPIL